MKSLWKRAANREQHCVSSRNVNQLSMLTKQPRDSMPLRAPTSQSFSRLLRQTTAGGMSKIAKEPFKLPRLNWGLQGASICAGLSTTAYLRETREIATDGPRCVSQLASHTSVRRPSCIKRIREKTAPSSGKARWPRIAELSRRRSLRNVVPKKELSGGPPPLLLRAIWVRA